MRDTRPKITPYQNMLMIQKYRKDPTASVRSLAKEFGISHNAVHQRLKIRGVKVKGKTRQEEVMTYHTVSEKRKGSENV